EGGCVRAVAATVSSEVRWVVLIPEIESATREARAVLPAQIPRADAVFNVQRVSLLLVALTGARPDLLGAAMDDRLHQPYRLQLFPWMERARAAARAAGALGCVLSGAGPSVLAATPHDVGPLPRALESALAEARPPLPRPP